MMSGTFLFHFSLLSTCRFTCSHFFLALVKHKKYFNYFFSAIFKVLTCCMSFANYYKSKRKNKNEAIVLIHKLSEAHSNYFHLLSEVYCVLDLDGGLGRNGTILYIRLHHGAARMSRMNVPSYGVSTASHTSYVSIRKDMWPQGRLAMRKTSLIAFSNFPQFLTRIFLSYCIIFIAANDIFPKRLLLPIYISVALARRFFFRRID